MKAPVVSFRNSLCLCVTLFFASFPVHAGGGVALPNNLWDNWEKKTYGYNIMGTKRYPDLREFSGRDLPSAALPLFILNHALLFYKHVLSTDSCPCYPSCSNYAFYSLNTYGVVIGAIMMCDRLFFHENSDLFQKAPKIIDGRRFVYYDPPEYNQVFLDEVVRRDSVALPLSDRNPF
jgi:hypothetical protein